MTVIVKTLVAPVQMANAQTTQYTTPAATRCIIDKATVTNTDTVARTFSANIVQSGGSASSANLVLDTKSVQPDETYLCPELVGQVLDPGAFLSTIASAASALTLRVSGREIS